MRGVPRERDRRVVPGGDDRLGAGLGAGVDCCGHSGAGRALQSGGRSKMRTGHGGHASHVVRCGHGGCVHIVSACSSCQIRAEADAGLKVRNQAEEAEDA